MVMLLHVLLQIAALTIALWYVQRTSHQLIFGFFGPKAYRFSIYLGVLVHELAHALFAKVLLNATHIRIALFETSSPDALGEMQFSYRKHAIASLMMPFVSFAPLFIGTVCIHLCLIYLGISSNTLLTPMSQVNPSRLAELSQWILIAYPLLSVSICLTPSQHDLLVALPGMVIWSIILYAGVWFFPALLSWLENFGMWLKDLLVICLVINLWLLGGLVLCTGAIRCYQGLRSRY
jgi:hypothetical protein